MQKLLLLCTALLFSTAFYAQQWGYYTLYSVQNSTSTFLMDTNGSTVKTWTHGSSAKTGYSSYLLPGGTLLRSVSRSGNSFSGGPICGQVQKVDWNGNVIWDFVYSTNEYCTHHDIHPMPNGNVLLIAYERKSASQATQAGCSQSIEIWSEKIVEIQPTGATTGTVVWEWHLWDHLVQNQNPSKDNYQTSIVDHPELIHINYNTQKDWMHMNGLDYNPILDQVTFSSHNLNEIYVIDHSTSTTEAAGHTGGNSGKGGDILYRWGNPAAYGASGDKIINVVHDAHWIPEGVPNAGRLVAFNNRGTQNKSTVDQVIPPLNGYQYSITPGSAFLPASYSERLVSSGLTQNMGNSQQLPNGNQLVCIATAGLIYEVDQTGTMLWNKTASGAVPQAFRYDRCYVENEAPEIPVVSENNGVLSTASATTYQWYLNGVLLPGETGQTIQPSQNGIYIVRITDNNGCVFRYSEGFTYTGSSLSVPEEIQQELAVHLYPNPTNGLVFIELPANTTSAEVMVYDVSGKQILQGVNLSVLDLSAYAGGMYYVHCKAPGALPVIKKIVFIP